MTIVRPFQRKFLRGAMDPEVNEAVLSIPRGNGKSWIAGYLLSRIMDPKDKLFRRGTESVVVASSLEQARIPYRFARSILEPKGGYNFSDNFSPIQITHRPTNTRIKVLGSNAKSAFGLVGCPWLIADEPGAWKVTGGQMMYDAISTSIGKPGSPLKVLYVGTLAPAEVGWWHDLVADGSQPGIYVQALQGDPERWNQWPEIRRVNPLTTIPPPFRKRLLQERDNARSDTRLKAQFLSYRLNIPTADESEVLLTTDDWIKSLGREVPNRAGKPLVGIDLGGGRAWSAAAAIWENGRAEALAIAPGIPSLAAQKKRDKASAGTYQRINRLRIADGRQVPLVSDLTQAIYSEWGRPARIICDRFRLAELQDALGPGGPFLEPRVTRWSEASEDIRALRKMAKDGPLSVDQDSRSLIQASLSVSRVKNDDQGSTRLAKKGTNNTARDDVAAALLLASGGWDRAIRAGSRRSVLQSAVIG